MVSNDLIVALLDLERGEVLESLDEEIKKCVIVTTENGRKSKIKMSIEIFPAFKG